MSNRNRKTVVRDNLVVDKAVDTDVVEPGEVVVQDDSRLNVGQAVKTQGVHVPAAEKQKVDQIAQDAEEKRKREAQEAADAQGEENARRAKEEAAIAERAAVAEGDKKEILDILDKLYLSVKQEDNRLQMGMVEELSRKISGDASRKYY